MKKIFLIVTILIMSSTYVSAEKNCKDLPGFKRMGENSKEYVKCLAGKIIKNPKLKLNTESKLTDWINKMRSK